MKFLKCLFSVLILVPIAYQQPQNPVGNYFAIPDNLGLSVSNVLNEMCRNEPDCFRKLMNPQDFVHQKKSCFQDLGCFSNRYPWISGSRPVKTPQSPSKVCTTAILFTRNVFGKPMEIYPNISPEWKQFMIPSAKTTFICHGFIDSAAAPWVAEMAKAILKRSDENVIAIDWTKGAGQILLNYFQAVGNTRIVSAVTTKFIYHLMRETLIIPFNMHFIGHSLGAHVLAYVAKDFHGAIGRLTGLDPAGPFFEGYPSKVRMDKNDAIFTEAIHTNVGGVGDVTEDGHCDFYLNVGFLQPSCVASTKAQMAVNCAHESSHQFYTSAIENPNCFLGVPVSISTIIAASVNTLAQGKLMQRFNNTVCDGGITHCVPMGLEAKDYKWTCLREHRKLFRNDKEHTGNYAVFTQKNYPYCVPQ